VQTHTELWTLQKTHFYVPFLNSATFDDGQCDRQGTANKGTVIKVTDEAFPLPDDERALQADHRSQRKV